MITPTQPHYVACINFSYRGAGNFRENAKNAVNFIFASPRIIIDNANLKKIIGSKFRSSYFREISMGAKRVKICTMRKLFDFFNHPPNITTSITHTYVRKFIKFHLFHTHHPFPHPPLSIEPALTSTVLKHRHRLLTLRCMVGSHFTVRSFLAFVSHGHGEYSVSVSSLEWP